MPKKVSIEASLVEEADCIPNDKIEEQILNALKENVLPWIKDVQTVSVI